ncbi:putative fatty acyl-CoA reductase CG5065 isoform X2 [Lycorma delicatula]|uniref:putative fatty acyl-CoA reductase CG5065 isoform X2 n=1 Tax=Lycorma delicatula TaxID=130591 RepID=UPI003F515A11
MSEVAQFYVGRSILVTGAYGFMGKVLLEKLLYACPDIKNIYIMVRPKRGKSIELRLEEMLKIPLFERLRKENPTALKKIIPLQADLSLEDLGLSEQSLKQLSDVSIIYHVAASLRLDAKLKDSVKMNLEGTYWLLELCKGLKKLEAFVYVSTAFCHCELEVMEERIYKPNVLPADVIRLCQWIDDESLHSITQNLLGVHPNAYTYTKRLAEGLVDSYFPELPIIVARPSIVTPAWKEPMCGWVDNLNGPVGLIVGGGKGVIRTMLCNADYHAEVIPVDVAINGLITIPWKLRGKNSIKPFTKFTETPVFNLTQSGTQPITWGEVLEIGKKATYENPFQVMLWYPNGSIRSNRMIHNLCVIFYHWLPAYIIDFLFVIFGKKPLLYMLDCAASGLFYMLLAWLLVSCSDTARYLLDSATDGLLTLPILRSLK